MHGGPEPRVEQFWIQRHVATNFRVLFSRHNLAVDHEDHFRRDRVDCNRASSTWKATEKGELQFGSWSRTSARCGSGSLHDRIVTEGANVTRFAIKDGHLFLSGMAAGGYYELEPAVAPKR